VTLPRLLLCLCLCCASLAAAGPLRAPAYASFQGLRLEQTLPGSSVHALIRDRLGSLWAGSDAGLARFTGTTWTVVGIGPEGRRFFVRSLLEAADGSLWVGTDRNGLWRLKAGQWTAFNRAAGLALPSERIQCLLETPLPSGGTRLWVGTEQGVAHFQDGAWTLPGPVPARASSGPPSAGGGLAGLMVWKLRQLREPDGTLRVWAATVRGLARLVGERWEWFEPGPRLDGHPGKGHLDVHANDVLSVPRPGGGHELWVSLWNGGLARWDGKVWSRFGLREGFPSINPTGLAQSQDASGKPVLWASTYDQGLAWFDGAWHPLGARDGAPSLTFLSLCALPGGKPSILAGTRNAGVQAVDLGGWAALGPRQGLPLDQVNGGFAETALAGQGRALWMGTSSGLVRWDETLGRLQTFPRTPAAGYITTLLAAPLADGRPGLWLGTLHGLLQYDGRAWKLLGPRDGFPEGSVASILESVDRSGVRTLWVAHSRGLAWLRQGRWSFRLASTEFAASDPITLASTRDAQGADSLWVATRAEGLQRLRQGRWEACDLSGLPSREILALLPATDAQGRAWLWAGLASGQVACLPVDQPGVRPQVFDASRLPGLSDHPVRSLCRDRQGRIYVLSLSGVTRFRLDQGDPTRPLLAADAFTMEDGLPSQACRGGFLDARGRVWVGTHGGAAVLDPAREAQAPPLGAPYFVKAEDVDTQQAIPDGASLGHRQRHLLFEFGVPVHLRFGDTQFRTQLVGQEAPGPWRSAAFREFTDLRAGSHLLRVWARTAVGTVSGPAEFRFRTRPAPWQHPLAYACYALLAAGAAYGYLRLRTRVLVQRARHLEAAVAAAMAEVKLLSGFLPICSYCKKIRDDQGYWAQLESYISRHSGAQFSHGVCPDCKKQVLAEMEAERKG